MSELTVRASTSTAIQFQLMSGTAGLNLTPYGTVEMYLRDNAGGTQVHGNHTNGDLLSVNGAAGGSVTWTPGTTHLVAGSMPYQGYFKLYSSASSWLFCPEDSEFTINVRESW